MNKIIKLWISIFNNRDRKIYDFSGYLKDMNIWIAAYSKISQNKGALTLGPNNKGLDGITLKQLENLKNSVYKGQYKWIGSKRILIPKPGKRLLSIPASSDKIVQEVLRIILEPLFELNFSEFSHGFRPGRSYHTALGQIDRDLKPIKWIIEGDLKSFFDKIDHEILIKLLEEKVKDIRLLNLIKQGLKVKIFTIKNESFYSDLSVPLGGILSPLLANLYLDKFDQFMEGIIKTYNKGIKPKHNKEYEKARYRKLSRKGIISYNPYDPTYRKLTYVRYGDEFLVGIRGPIKDSFKIKEEITNYLKDQLKITLNLEKTKISHIKNNIEFLGHRIIRKDIRVWSKFYTKTGIKFRKSKHTRYGLHAITSKLLKKFKTLGVIGLLTDRYTNKQKLVGKTYFPFLPYQQSEIILKFNSIIRGFTEWWKYADNRCKTIHFIAYLLKYSAAKTLAHKYKISLKKVISLTGKDLSKPIKNMKPIFGVTDESVNKEHPINKKFTPILYHKYSDIPKPQRLYFGINWKPQYLKKLEKISEMTNSTNKSKFIEELLENVPKDCPLKGVLSILTRGLTRGIK